MPGPLRLSLKLLGLHMRICETGAQHFSPVLGFLIQPLMHLLLNTFTESKYLYSN